MTFPTLPDWANRETVLLVCLGACIVGHAGYLWWSAKRNPLIRGTDIMTGDNGRIASNKAFQAWAFGLSAWAMVWFTATGHGDQMGWAAWVAIWAGAALGNKQINNSAVAKAQEAAATSGAPPPIPQVGDKS